jgi:hypothetical protein
VGTPDTSELRRLGGAGEGNDVADVAEAAGELDGALEAQPEARVRPVLDRVKFPEFANGGPRESHPISSAENVQTLNLAEMRIARQERESVLERERGDPGNSGTAHFIRKRN